MLGPFIVAAAIYSKPWQHDDKDGYDDNDDHPNRAGIGVHASAEIATIAIPVPLWGSLNLPTRPILRQYCQRLESRTMAHRVRRQRGSTSASTASSMRLRILLGDS